MLLSQNVIHVSGRNVNRVFEKNVNHVSGRNVIHVSGRNVTRRGRTTWAWLGPTVVAASATLRAAAQDVGASNFTGLRDMVTSLANGREVARAAPNEISRIHQRATPWIK